jgi:hypothetical protein
MPSTKPDGPEAEMEWPRFSRKRLGGCQETREGSKSGTIFGISPSVGLSGGSFAQSGISAAVAARNT